jgi:hypothetical protein
MTNWPDKTLIRIVRGREYDEPVSDVLAARSGDDEYLLATGPRAGNSILHKALSDDIDEWEEVTAVPTAALKRLQGAFRGVDVIESLEPPLLEVLSCLPADKPSPLDRAVTRVKDADGRFLHPSHTPHERLAILLDEIASVLDKRTRKDSLYVVTRLCVEWASDVQPAMDALKRAAQMAEGEEQVWHPESDEERYRGMAICAGQVSAGMGDTDTGLREALCLTAGRALAWSAQIIEEEDK